MLDNDFVKKQTTLPVFHDQSPLSCEGCGCCCEGIGSPVLVYATGFRGRIPERPNGLPAPLIEEIDFHFSGLHRGQEPQERCLWFDVTTRGCKHYEFRPSICREYELGGTACLLTRELREKTSGRIGES